MKNKKFRLTSNEDADQFLFLKNSDLHLMKMQINFYFENFRFASNEDANSFYFEKFRFTYNEDANQFLFLKKM